MTELTSTALVTGGSRGIGRAIAETLAEQGFQVYFTYVSRPKEAEEVTAAIEAKGDKARAFRLNVGDPAAVVDFFQREIKDKVRLDVLVNNAGITKDGLILRMKDDDFDAVINVNLKGAFTCIREAAKTMSKQRSGSIVNISSVVGQMGNPGQVNYSAAKAGLIGMTKTAARELGVRHIRVNAIAPGFIRTEMTDALPEDVQKAYMSNIPLQRFGSVRDIAQAVAFLASPASAYITGQVLAVNGGLYC